MPSERDKANPLRFQLPRFGWTALLAGWVVLCAVLFLNLGRIFATPNYTSAANLSLGWPVVIVYAESGAMAQFWWFGAFIDPILLLIFVGGTIVSVDRWTEGVSRYPHPIAAILTIYVWWLIFDATNVDMLIFIGWCSWGVIFAAVPCVITAIPWPRSLKQIFLLITFFLARMAARILFCLRGSAWNMGIDFLIYLPLSSVCRCMVGAFDRYYKFHPGRTPSMFLTIIRRVPNAANLTLY